MSETIMKNSSKDYKELVESLGSLFEMQNEDNDRKAAALYRAKKKKKK